MAQKDTKLLTKRKLYILRKQKQNYIFFSYVKVNKKNKNIKERTPYQDVLIFFTLRDIKIEPVLISLH